MNVLDENYKIIKEFRKLCYGAVNTYGGRIITFIEQPRCCNYIVAHLKTLRQEVYLVASFTAPYLAFSKVEPIQEYDWEKRKMRREFQAVNIPEFTEYFSPYFEVLTVEKLHEKVDIKGNKIVGYSLGNDLPYPVSNYRLESVYLWEVIFSDSDYSRYGY